MTILVCEENLIWSARLRQSIAGLGHTPVVLDRWPESWPTGDIAIVNLGSRVFPPDRLIPSLKEAGFRLIAHAGHKETPLLDLGRETGCDLVVSNSTLTHRLAETLAELEATAKAE